MQNFKAFKCIPKTGSNLAIYQDVALQRGFATVSRTVQLLLIWANKKGRIAPALRFRI